jgi:hypothetical protein
VFYFSLLYIRPFYILVFALVLQCIAVFAGDALRRHRHLVDETEAKDMGTLLPASLTLLALIIGFSFSMAASRYDQRKALEENEANAIGTEYVRADLFPAQAARIQKLLTEYTTLRVQFYEQGDLAALRQTYAATMAVQGQLWAAVAPTAAAAPTPVAALVASGMNDVLNSQSYAQAMYWNRLPPGTWLLLLLVATHCSLLFGYSEYRAARKRLIILPLIVALPLFLIADMDSPRRGLIHVVPQNLLALQASLTHDGGGTP